MIPDAVSNWWYSRTKDKQERKPTRADIRAFVRSRVRCDQCHARVKRVNLDQHLDRCRGYIQRPVASRKFKVASPWPKEKSGKSPVG